MKKGQGISLNVIIIAAIALIVLVVLIAIFTGRLGGFQRDLAEVSDSEVFRIQTISDSRCVPSKTGIETIKAEVSGYSELQADQIYNQRVQDMISLCSANVFTVSSEAENRERCNAVRDCTWK